MRNRRSFLTTTVAAVTGGWSGPTPRSAATLRHRLGVFVSLEDKDPDRTMALVRELEFDLCEIYTNQVDADSAARCRRAMDQQHVEASAVFTSGPGRAVWNLEDGPDTLGLVPRPDRAARVAALKQASDFAKICGSPAFETHVGFIPENPRDPLYRETVEAVREVAGHCRANGQIFLYHAGQETPLTLLRTMQDVGLDNQGVGLDTANLILCGKGHPIDALEIYGKHLRAVNVKDGLWPTDPRQFGQETPLGQGRVDFPRFLKRLTETGYRGPLIIEREVPAARIRPEVKVAKAYLEGLLSR
jgi:L-ribulose-5-phosphate 3-epimerase